MRDLKAKISKNFRYGEFVKSETAEKFGIQINPTEQQWKNIETLVAVGLQPIADKFGGINVNSGIRPKELTFAVRSPELYKVLKENGENAKLQAYIDAVSSNHGDGYASDIEPLDKDVTLMEIIEYIVANLPYTEVIAEYFPNGWVHYAYNQNAEHSKLKLKDADHNYEVVTIEYLRKLYGAKS